MKECGSIHVEILLRMELNCILSLCPNCFVLSLVTFLNLALIYSRIPFNNGALGTVFMHRHVPFMVYSSALRCWQVDNRRPRAVSNPSLIHVELRLISRGDPSRPTLGT